MKLRIIKKVTGTVGKPVTEYIIQEKPSLCAWQDKKEVFVYIHQGNGDYTCPRQTDLRALIFANPKSGRDHAEVYLNELQNPFILEYKNNTIRKSLLWPLSDGRYIYYVDKGSYIIADFDLEKLKSELDKDQKIIDDITVIKEVEITRI